MRKLVGAAHADEKANSSLFFFAKGMQAYGHSLGVFFMNPHKQRSVDGVRLYVAHVCMYM
jgi:hypothetical protein